jgi:beta-lactamase class A
MTLEAQLRETLEAFCGDDRGRSVSLRGYRPDVPTLSVRGSESRPAASVIKVALAMAVYREAARGTVDLDARVPVAAFTATRYVSILAGFDKTRDLSVREICRLALITSDNPLAVYLQTLVSFETVNRLLAEIGCGPSCRMAAGFSEDELGPKNRVNVVTTDAAIVLLLALRSDPLYADLVVALKNNLRNNRIPALLPDDVAIIHKTGSLDGVANDIGLVEDERVTFAIAFLTDGQADTARTSNDIAVCSHAVWEALRSVD